MVSSDYSGGMSTGLLAGSWLGLYIVYTLKGHQATEVQKWGKLFVTCIPFKPLHEVAHTSRPRNYAVPGLHGGLSGRVKASLPENLLSPAPSD